MLNRALHVLELYHVAEMIEIYVLIQDHTTHTKANLRRYISSNLQLQNQLEDKKRDIDELVEHFMQEDIEAVYDEELRWVSLYSAYALKNVFGTTGAS